MKKLVLIFAAAGFVLASCGGSECLECTGASASMNACADDEAFGDDEAAWDAFVALTTGVAASAGDSCTVVE